MRLMSTDSAQIERVLTSAVEMAAPVSPHLAGDDLDDRGHPMGVARGIANAILLSVPFWALFGFALYLLI
jgi:hypothetical protein